ncbi:MAG: hypothetical protein ACK4MD_06180 [Demequina sp.]
MGKVDPAAVWGVPIYLERHAGLPDMGRSPLGPVGLTSSDTNAILSCENTAAVAEMKAYARSYVGVAGAALVSSIATVAFGLAGKRGMTAASAAGAIVTGSVVLEARRRSRQWEAVIDARLTAGPSSN